MAAAVVVQLAGDVADDEKLTLQPLFRAGIEDPYAPKITIHFWLAQAESWIHSW